MPGGPPPLRDIQNITGYSDLRPADAVKVHNGNTFLRFCCRLIRACIATKTVGLLENPHTSWAWKMPEMLSLMKLPLVAFSRTDFCQWGTPWRKATGIISVFVDFQPFCRVCTGRGQCSRTSLPHQILKGQREDGVFWTLVAEPYPEIFCRCMARCCARAVTQLQSRPMEKILQSLE